LQFPGVDAEIPLNLDAGRWCVEISAAIAASSANCAMPRIVAKYHTHGSLSLQNLSDEPLAMALGLRRPAMVKVAFVLGVLCPLMMNNASLILALVHPEWAGSLAERPTPRADSNQATISANLGSGSSRSEKRWAAPLAG
jgi:hypothetical protein